MIIIVLTSIITLAIGIVALAYQILFIYAPRVAQLELELQCHQESPINWDSIPTMDDLVTRYLNETPVKDRDRDPRDIIDIKEELPTKMDRCSPLPTKMDRCSPEVSPYGDTVIG